ncbi:hypothetical protein HHI36_007978 [Cryptolaemus montrouzieri]|uniref:Retrotransposon gag domain-containing protein n=1 Tax=Cryptolaemus montrouzieri TaxID=559131 RepID=A0ABD2MR65_9CUCU
MVNTRLQTQQNQPQNPAQPTLIQNQPQNPAQPPPNPAQPPLNQNPNQVNPHQIHQNIAGMDINVALRIIPEFNGIRRDLHKFITCCDEMADTCTTNDDRKMLLNVIKSKLSSTAYDIVKYKAFANWDELKLILQNQFLERRTTGQMQYELSTVKQNFNEDVRSYANRVEKLLIDLNEAMVTHEGVASAPLII